MKVKRLYAKHIKGIREITLHAGPGVNEIGGKNGAGKTSLLDCLFYGMAGKRAVDARALRDGCSEGKVEIETDNGLLLVLKLREGKGSSLTIKAPDGKKMGQRDLDQLWSAFTFDPLAFTRMKPADQVAELRQLAGEKYVQALAAKDAELTEATENRTLVNRQLSSFGRLEPVEEVEEVEVAAVAQELREAEEFNREQDEVERRKMALYDHVERCERDVRELRKHLADAEQTLAEVKAEYAAAPEDNPRLNTSALHARLAEAGARNKQAEAFRAYRAQLEKQQELARQSEDLDRIVSKLREERLEMAKCAALPVSGLTFSDSGVRFNGLPFEQLSSSEALRISSRIGAASLGPPSEERAGKMEFMRIKDGSLLDEDSWAELESISEETGIQFFVESVGEGHGDAVVLEEGAVREKF